MMGSGDWEGSQCQPVESVLLGSSGKFLVMENTGMQFLLKG